MAEIARNNVAGHKLVMKCALIRLVSYTEKNCRNHFQRFREIVGACHVCFPKSCCGGKHVLLVLLAGGWDVQI